MGTYAQLTSPARCPPSSPCSHVPAIAAVLAALAALRRQLQPLYDAAAWAEKQWAELLLL